MITVACVLKSGGIYDRDWVYRLRDGVRNHLSLEHRFVCLSDMAVSGVEVIPLINNWPRWWSKIELFRPGILRDTVLYFDLDTIIVGDLERIARFPHTFTMAHEYYRPQHLCSTAMAWDGDSTLSLGIYEAFARNPARHMRRCDVDLPKINRMIGDQAFIETHLENLEMKPVTFMGLFGERTIASYKVHECHAAPPVDAVAVAFHGKPKPHQITSGWVAERWGVYA